MNTQILKMEKAVTSRTRNYVKSYKNSASDSGSEKSFKNYQSKLKSYVSKEPHSNEITENTIKTEFRLVDKQNMTITINNDYYNKDNLFKDYVEVNNNSESSDKLGISFIPNRNNVSTPIESEKIDAKTKSKLPLSQDKFSKRVVEYLKREPNGIWASTIISTYEKDYNEFVGKGWVDLLEGNEDILMDKDENGTVILCYKGNLPKSKKMIIEPMKITSLTANTPVQIVKAVSTIEIWAQVQSGKNELQKTLNSFYKQLQPNAVNIEIGGCYIVDFHKNMNRVKVLGIGKDKFECFFLDSGEVDWVQSSNFYNIMFNHSQIEPKAFVCGLDGLEELCNSNIAKCYLKEILHKNIIIKVNQIDTVPKVTIFTKENGKKINLNEEISEAIYNHFTHPNLKKDDIHQVYVTHINDDGSLLVQWQNIAYNKYTEYMDQLLSIDFSKYKNYANESIIPDDIFITLWPQDSQYYRCKVLDISTDKTTVQVLFVDYGNEDTLVLEDCVLYLAKDVSRPLAWFPFQVTEVFMDGLESHRIQRMKEIVTLDETVWIKVVGKKKRCEFFKLENGVVFSINCALKLEEELPKSVYKTDDVLEIDTKLEELSKKVEHIWGNIPKNSEANEKKSKGQKRSRE